MRILFFISAFLFFIIVGNPVKKIISDRPDKIYADNFNNLWSVKDNTLVKYNENGEKIYEYNAPFGEKITSVDLRNPLKIPVFFKNQNKIIFLDNTSNETGNEIMLENFGILGDCYVAGNEINGLWILDLSENMLYKFDSDFKPVFKLNVFDIEGDIVYITSNTGFLFLANDKNDVFVFDNKGNFLYKTGIKIPFEFIADENFLKYPDTSRNTFVLYDFKEDTLSRFSFPSEYKIRLAAQSTDYLFFADDKNVFRKDF